MSKPGDERKIGLPRQLRKVPVAHRDSEREEVASLLSSFGNASESDGFSTGNAPNVISIVDTGMAGKTTFLKEDIKPLIDSGTALGRGATDAAPLAKAYRWVYVECDNGGAMPLKTRTLLAMYLELGRRGFVGKRFAFALSHLNNLRKGVFKVIGQEVWGQVEQVAASGERGAGAWNSSDGSVRHAVEIVSRLLSLASSLELVSEPVATIVELARSIWPVAEAVNDFDAMRWADDVSRDLVNAMTADQIEDNLELFFLSDFIDAENEAMPCIVIDGAEALVEQYGDPATGEVSWLCRIIEVLDSEAFFIIAGRRQAVRTIKGLPCRSVALQPISWDSFQKMVRGRGLRRFFRSRFCDRSVYQAAKNLPGILAMYASIAPAMGWSANRKISQAVAKRFNDASKKDPYDGGYIRDVVDQFILHCSQQMHTCEWQLVTWLVWLREWNSEWVLDVIPEAGVYTENISVIRDLPFIEDMGRGSYRFHQIVVEAIRDKCSKDTLVSLQKKLGALDDKNLPQDGVESANGALEALAALWL